MQFSLEEIDIFNRNGIFSGSDEAGRGCLAGPVVGASVILPIDFDGSTINDSKKLNFKSREEAFKLIINNCSNYSYHLVDNYEIDRINILQAAVKSMNDSIKSLKIIPDISFIDGNYFYSNEYKYKTIIKGDSKYMSIAAASIIAKVIRDNWMINIASTNYPEYDFNIHKGYATRLHFEKLDKFGISPIHRKSFLVKYFNRKNALNIF